MTEPVPVKINHAGYFLNGKTVPGHRIDWHGVDCWELFVPLEPAPYVIPADWGRALSTEGKTDGASCQKAG